MDEKDFKEASVSLAKTVLTQADNLEGDEVENCCRWFHSAVSKLLSANQDMTLLEAAEFFRESMPRSFKAWCDYLRQT